MLLFIWMPNGKRKEYRNFKTSHVIVYQHRPHSHIHLTVISKHLMLLFIAKEAIADLKAVEFQNISCYCLSCTAERMESTDQISKHLMLLFIPRISAFFNFSPPLFPLIFSIFLHFLPANTLILDRPTYHPINLLIFQAFLDFSFFFRLVKIL